MERLKPIPSGYSHRGKLCSLRWLRNDNKIVKMLYLIYLLASHKTL